MTENSAVVKTSNKNKDKNNNNNNNSTNKNKKEKEYDNGHDDNDNILTNDNPKMRYISTKRSSLDCVSSLKKKKTKRINVGGLNVVLKETTGYKIKNNHLGSKRSKSLETYTKTCSKNTFKNEVKMLKFFKNTLSDRNRFYPLLIHVNKRKLKFTTLGEDGCDIHRLVVNNEYIHKTMIKIKIENNIYALFKLIIQAYKNLYDLNIIHGDIKPDNIHINCKNMKDVNEECSVIFLDFETCFYLKDTPTLGGCPDYASPEVYNGIVDSTSEVFSFGIVFYAILTGRLLVNQDIPRKEYEKKIKKKTDTYKDHFIMYLNNIKYTILEISYAKNKYFKKLIEIMVERRERRIRFDVLINMFSGDIENFKNQLVEYSINLNN